MSEKTKIALILLGCVALVMVVLLVIPGCSSPCGVTGDQISESGERAAPVSLSGMGGPILSYPRVSDSLYQADTRSWVIPVAADSIWFSVDIARSYWFEVREFDIQGVEFKGDSIAVADSCRWLSGWYYKVKKL